MQLCPMSRAVVVFLVANGAAGAFLAPRSVQADSRGFGKSNLTTAKVKMPKVKDQPETSNKKLIQPVTGRVHSETANADKSFSFLSPIDDAAIGVDRQQFAKPEEQAIAFNISGQADMVSSKDEAEVESRASKESKVEAAMSVRAHESPTPKTDTVMPLLVHGPTSIGTLADDPDTVADAAVAEGKGEKASVHKAKVMKARAQQRAVIAGENARLKASSVAHLSRSYQKKAAHKLAENEREDEDDHEDDDREHDEDEDEDEEDEGDFADEKDESDDDRLARRHRRARKIDDDEDDDDGDDEDEEDGGDFADEKDESDADRLARRHRRARIIGS